MDVIRSFLDVAFAIDCDGSAETLIRVKRLSNRSSQQQLR